MPHSILQSSENAPFVIVNIVSGGKIIFSFLFSLILFWFPNSSFSQNKESHAFRVIYMFYCFLGLELSFSIGIYCFKWDDGE